MNSKARTSFLTDGAVVATHEDKSSSLLFSGNSSSRSGSKGSGDDTFSISNSTSHSVGMSSAKDATSKSQSLSQSQAHLHSYFQPTPSTTFFAATSLPSPKSRRSSERRISNLALEKFNLRLHKVPLVGSTHKKLAETIKKACHNTIYPDSRRKSDRQWICIAGNSGSGKTFLAKAAVQPLQQKQTNNSSMVVVAYGKFNTLQREEPFAGLQSAMISLCQQLGASESKSKISDLLVKGLGRELHVLIPVIPNLADVVDADILFQRQKDEEEAKAKATDDKNITLQQSGDRLKFLIRKFLQIITQIYSSIIWICDDVQWADPASLDVMESLMMDDSIKGLVMVCCYRNEEDEENGNENENNKPLPFFQISNNIKELQKYRSIGVVDALTVEPLNIEDVAEMLAEVLSQDSHKEDVKDLATVIHRRTAGNPFAVTQFVPTLIRDKLLTINIATMEWTWDVDRVRNESTSTLNVIDLVQSRLRVDVASKESLIVAACLGSVFQRNLLERILKGFCDDKTDYKTKFQEIFKKSPSPLTDEVLHEWVESSVVEVFDASDDNESYAFLHDKIREAAVSMISIEMMSTLRYMIGDILFRCLNDIELEEHAFMVADLTRVASDTFRSIRSNKNDFDVSKRLLPSDPSELIKMVLLNQRAGAKAIEKAAFVSANEFYQYAISLLPSNHWETYQDLSLDLYSSVTECSYATGNFPETRQYGETVTKTTNIPLLDKMRVAYSLMELELSEASTDRSIDATRICVDVLAKLGCKFPRTNLGIQFKTMACMLAMKKAAKRGIDQMSRSYDPTDIAVLKTLDKLATTVYLVKPNLLPLCIATAVRWSLRYGYTEFSPPSFAFAGMLVAYFMGDFQSGVNLGRTSMEMAKIMKSHSSFSRTVLINHVYCFHFADPFQKSIEPLLHGYKIGMANGDVQSGLYCIYFFVINLWLTGTHLKKIVDDASTYAKIMKDYRQDVHVLGIRSYRQIFENLHTGPSTSRLVGTAFNEDTDIVELENANDLVQLAIYWRSKLSVCTFFGDFSTAAEFALKHGEDILKYQPGQPECAWVIYCCGLACFVQAQRGSPKSRRKHKAYAMKCSKKLKDWVRQGNPNCIHLDELLEAELERVRGNKFLCLKQYETGILVAGRQGLIHIQALGNERLASYWESLGHSREESKYRLEQSIKYYEEWGANNKVAQLQALHNEQLSVPFQIMLDPMVASMNVDVGLGLGWSRD